MNIPDNMKALKQWRKVSLLESLETSHRKQEGLLLKSGSQNEQ
jgi:hypothetical protein